MIMNSTTDQYNFTYHAYKRMKERTSLDEADLIKILTEKKYEIIGKEKDFSLFNYLFFSIIDDDFFVCTVDEKEKEIITVQPCEYWDNLRKKKNYNIIGKITYKGLFEAVRKVNRNHDIVNYPPVASNDHIRFIINGQKDNGIVVSKKGGEITIASFLGFNKDLMIDQIEKIVVSNLFTYSH